MLHIVLTNFKRMLSEKRAIIGIILAPVFIICFFGFMNVSMDASVTATAIGITSDRDSEFTNHIKDSLVDSGVYSVQDHASEEELREAIKERKVSMGIAIPKEGDPIVLAGGKANYEALQISLTQLLDSMTSDTVNEWQVQVIDTSASSSEQGVMAVAGFIINFMMYSLLFITYDIMDMKKFRVLKRTYTAPYTGFQLLSGIMLSMFALMAVQFIAINAVLYFIFNTVLIKNVLGGIMIFVPYIFAILGLGILLGRLTKNPDFTPLTANLIIIPLAVVSGTFFPKGFLPSFLERFAFISPQYWVADGIKILNAPGASVTEIIPHAVIMMLLAVIMVLASSYKFETLLED